MEANLVLNNSALVSLWVLAISLIFPVIRLFRGPDLANRVVALDHIAVLIVAMMFCDVLYARDLRLLDAVLAVSLLLVFSSMIITRYLFKKKEEK